ncbi:MAG: hypothetical protein RBS99_11470, partial [Rhodospirillales bacterium]|nr:hypothetical protein [Rhodospirillales bacterium]
MTTAATHLQSAASSDREPFAAFVADELTRAALMRIGAERGWPTLHVLRGGVIEAVEVLSRVPTPRLIVLDLSDSADPILEITQMANVCEQETRLIVLGRTNDITLFREMIALGVDDYLLKPVSAELLAAAIDKLANSTVPGGEAERAGRLVVVTNARGGAGATSIAVNTAWLIAHEQGRRVALVDFDLH